jgi:hypothetical protein
VTPTGRPRELRDFLLASHSLVHSGRRAKVPAGHVSCTLASTARLLVACLASEQCAVVTKRYRATGGFRLQCHVQVSAARPLNLLVWALVFPIGSNSRQLRGNCDESGPKILAAFSRICRPNTGKTMDLDRLAKPNGL